MLIAHVGEASARKTGVDDIVKKLRWMFGRTSPVRAAILLLIAGAVGCGTAATQPARSAAGLERPTRAIYLAPSDAGYDLITVDGIHVRTNGQYKTQMERKAAGVTIDRYWHDVRSCALGLIPRSSGYLRDKILPEFPRHLSIEIANDWRVIEGPATHRRQQGFPSLRRPGAWSTASREEEALYVRVVPELKGLSRQMAGELNLWLGGNTNTLPTELSNVCNELPCYKFSYDNSPSQAWSECRD